MTHTLNDLWLGGRNTRLCSVFYICIYYHKLRALRTSNRSTHSVSVCSIFVFFIISEYIYIYFCRLNKQNIYLSNWHNCKALPEVNHNWAQIDVSWFFKLIALANRQWANNFNHFKYTQFNKTLGSALTSMWNVCTYIYIYLCIVKGKHAWPFGPIFYWAVSSSFISISWVEASLRISRYFNKRFPMLSIFSPIQFTTLIKLPKY